MATTSRGMRSQPRARARPRLYPPRRILQPRALQNVQDRSRTSSSSAPATMTPDDLFQSTSAGLRFLVLARCPWVPQLLGAPPSGSLLTLLASPVTFPWRIPQIPPLAQPTPRSVCDRPSHPSLVPLAVLTLRDVNVSHQNLRLSRLKIENPIFVKRFCLTRRIPLLAFHVVFLDTTLCCFDILHFNHVRYYICSTRKILGKQCDDGGGRWDSTSA
jgi:hypothetical protein